MSDLTRLDIETKVALMAALLYDQDSQVMQHECVLHAVDVAMAIEKESHRRVSEQMHAGRKNVGSATISLDKV